MDGLDLVLIDEVDGVESSAGLLPRSLFRDDPPLGSVATPLPAAPASRLCLVRRHALTFEGNLTVHRRARFP
jgi:hypothetical protein